MNNEQSSDLIQSSNIRNATTGRKKERNSEEKLATERSKAVTRESTAAGMAVHQPTGETHSGGAHSISGSQNTWHVSENTTGDQRTDGNFHPRNDSQRLPAHQKNHVSLHIRNSSMPLGTTHSSHPCAAHLSIKRNNQGSLIEAQDRQFNIMSIGERNMSRNENVSGSDSATMDDQSESSASINQHPYNDSSNSKTITRRKRSHKSKPGQTAGRWTPEEHQGFLEGLKIFGREWKKVAERIPTRTSAQIRSHAQKYFAKIQREESIFLQDQAAASAAVMTTNNNQYSHLQESNSVDTGTPQVVPPAQVPQAVQRNVDRILANPNNLEREVEDTLYQLRERYRQLQIRLQETNERRSRAPTRPRGSIVENEDHYQPLRPASAIVDRRKRALEDTLSVSSVPRYHHQDDFSSVSSTVSAFSPSREFDSEELIALSVLGGSLPRSASSHDLVSPQAAIEDSSNHEETEDTTRQSRSPSPASTIASHREAAEGGLDESSNSDKSKKRKITQDSTPFPNQDDTNHTDGEDGDETSSDGMIH